MAASLAARFSPDLFRFKKVDKVVALSVTGAVLLAWLVVVALDAMQAFVG